MVGEAFSCVFYEVAMFLYVSFIDYGVVWNYARESSVT